jgi:hypothetical protein
MNDKSDTAQALVRPPSLAGLSISQVRTPPREPRHALNQRRGRRILLRRLAAPSRLGSLALLF